MYLSTSSLDLTCTLINNLPLTSGMPDLGSDGVRCFTNDDVRGRVEGFVGDDSVPEEMLALTAT